MNWKTTTSNKRIQQGTKIQNNNNNNYYKTDRFHIYNHHQFDYVNNESILKSNKKFKIHRNKVNKKCAKPMGRKL